jgi:glutamate carboxypeptidase
MSVTPPPPARTFAQQYLSYMHSYQDELLERLATLVNIDSGTRQIAGINRVVAQLDSWLQELGFSTSQHPVHEFGNNLIARRTGKGRARLMLVGHVDTVYPEGSAQIQPFSIDDGKAYGPGVADMKSGILMGMYAVRALLEDGFEDFGEICLALNNDEEVGSVGSKTLLQEVARQMDAGLVLEPARHIESITQARKGTERYVLEIRGVPAHSGVDPYNGRSAVVELAYKILAVQNLNAIYPGTTFNLTRISSSEQLNIIPDMARCWISVRAFSQQALDKAAAALEAIASSHSVPETRAILERTRGRTPYTPTPELQALVKDAQAEGNALGLSLQPERRGGVSDGNTLMEVGLPTLDSLGPTGHHTHNLQLEYLELDAIPRRGALLAGIIRQVCAKL